MTVSTKTQFSWKLLLICLYSSKRLPIQSQQEKHKRKMWNTFKTNNKGVICKLVIGIGTDITNVIIYSSMGPMDPKHSRVVT